MTDQKVLYISVEDAVAGDVRAWAVLTPTALVDAMSVIGDHVNALAKGRLSGIYLGSTSSNWGEAMALVGQASAFVEDYADDLYLHYELIDAVGSVHPPAVRIDSMVEIALRRAAAIGRDLRPEEAAELWKEIDVLRFERLTPDGSNWKARAIAEQSAREVLLEELDKALTAIEENAAIAEFGHVRSCPFCGMRPFRGRKEPGPHEDGCLWQAVRHLVPHKE
jgi:hypothetical protein